jgi:hypothetical protein
LTLRFKNANPQAIPSALEWLELVQLAAQSPYSLARLCQGFGLWRLQIAPSNVLNGHSERPVSQIGFESALLGKPNLQSLVGYLY